MKNWTAVWMVSLYSLALGVPATASTGTDGASFLNIPVGARPAALGSAYSALATDAYAPTINPGGLGFVDSTQLAGQHLSYLESVHYEQLSVVHPFNGNHALGFSAQYLGSGDIPGADSLGNPTGSYSSHFAAYSAAYGQTVGQKLSLGVTGKVIDAKISDVSARAYAGDLGALYKATSHLQFAAVVTNLGTQLTFLNHGDDLALKGTLGAAYQPNSHCVLTTEGVYSKTGALNWHGGAEWRPLELLSVRVGYRTDTLKELSALAGFSTGIGINVWGQELAYAWVPYGDLGDTQYFSLLLRFGGKEEVKRNLIQYQTIKKHKTAENMKPTDPDYQQLMQLLDENQEHVAQSKTIEPGQ
jgi:hypothetical protein